MKKLLFILALVGCRMQGPHMGPHRLELVETFSQGLITYEVYACWKERCLFRDTFPNPRYR